jgi:hypothetical protein
MKCNAEEGMLDRAVAYRGHIGLSLSLSLSPSLLLHTLAASEREIHGYIQVYIYTMQTDVCSVKINESSARIW